VVGVRSEVDGAEPDQVEACLERDLAHHLGLWGRHGLKLAADDTENSAEGPEPAPGPAVPPPGRRRSSEMSR
jgi:hypothetical protein